MCAKKRKKKHYAMKFREKNVKLLQRENRNAARGKSSMLRLKSSQMRRVAKIPAEFLYMEIRRGARRSDRNISCPRALASRFESGESASFVDTRRIFSVPITNSDAPRARSLISKLRILSHLKSFIARITR